MPRRRVRTAAAVARLGSYSLAPSLTSQQLCEIIRYCWTFWREKKKKPVGPLPRVAEAGEATRRLLPLVFQARRDSSSVDFLFDLGDSLMSCGVVFGIRNVADAAREIRTLARGEPVFWMTPAELRRFRSVRLHSSSREGMIMLKVERSKWKKWRVSILE